MDFPHVLMILFYWFFLAGVVFLTGAFTGRIFVTGPSKADICIVESGKSSFGESAVRSIFLIAVLTFFASIVHLVLHASIMTETPLKEVFSILSPFLTKTKYGRFTVFRMIFVGIIVFLSFMGMKKNTRGLTVSGILASCCLLVVIAMSGHQGTKGYFKIPFYLDVLHLIAVSLWIGGLFFIRFCYTFFLEGAGADLWEQFCCLINRYSRIATYSVALVGLTGLLLTYFNIKDVAQLIGTRYGQVLLLKFLLVGVLFLFGGINKFFNVPAFNQHDTNGWADSLPQRKRLFRLVTAEVSIGIVVLLLTSILTHLHPEG
jgi:putative copper resistance protein D